jgi:hypothetical protein
MTTPPRTYPRAEVLAMLEQAIGKVTWRTLNNWQRRESNPFPKHNLCSRKVFFLADQVDAWLASNLKT